MQNTADQQTMLLDLNVRMARTAMMYNTVMEVGMSILILGWPCEWYRASTTNIGGPGPAGPHDRRRH